MAWASILGGLLSAGGQIAGGALGAQGGIKPSDQISASYNPYLDYGLQTTQFDALNGLGFGDINAIPDPFERLFGRIASAPLDNKTRRRAYEALSNIRQDPSLLNDPYGLGFTRDEVFAANKNGAPFGRVVTRGPEGGGIWGNSKNSKVWDGLNAPLGGQESPLVPGNTPGAKWVMKNVFGMSEDTQPTGLPIKNIGRLKASLAAAGIGLNDLADVMKQTEEFNSQIQRLKDAGLGGLNEKTILGRANAASTAAGLLGDAANYANGTAPTDFQNSILNRVNRDIKDQETKTLLQAQYGGYNPGEALMGIQRMKADSNLTALQQAIAAANALTAGLAPGLQAAQAAAGMGSNASNNALGIAAQQASAANALNNGSSINRADSLANGIAGGANAIGNSALTYYLMNGNRNAPAVGGTDTGSEWNWG